MFTLKPLTVESVMASFNKTITDLDSVAASNESVITAQEAIILEAEEKKSKCQTEVKQATGIATKLRAMIEPEAE